DTHRAAAQLAAELRQAGPRVRLDDRVDTSFGRRSVEWELKGVPVRVEVGPRELAAGTVTIVRRDTISKRPVPLAGVVEEVGADLRATQADLLGSARAERDRRTTAVRSVPQAVEAAEDGFATLPWSQLGPAGEEELARSGLTVRCLRRPDGVLTDDESDPELLAVVVKAY
ncbi:MAG: His/Gly/Thr/Pro-type tRNA ligase C-terminal domain-containing protein, partial [Acidimicrobiales bacterium]